MSETLTNTLEVLDHLIAQADQRHMAQVAHLRSLVTRGESITDAMRVLVEIEDELVRLNDQRVSLMLPA